MGKKHDLPAMPFYCGDWLKCPEVLSLKRSERSVWLDMMCLMWESTERGVLVNPKGNPYTDEQLTNMLSIGYDVLKVLEDSGVYSRREIDGAIYSRRMVRDEKTRKKMKENGKKGGNPNLDNQNYSHGLTKNTNMVNQKPNQYTENENENENDNDISLSLNDNVSIIKERDIYKNINNKDIVELKKQISLIPNHENTNLKIKIPLNEDGCPDLTYFDTEEYKQKLEEVNNKSKPVEIKKEPKKFIPPTKEEILSFANEKNLDNDVDAFFNYYESNGWKVGKNKMSKWKNAYSGWISRNKNYNKNYNYNTKPKQEGTFDYSLDKLPNVIYVTNERVE